MSDRKKRLAKLETRAPSVANEIDLGTDEHGVAWVGLTHGSTRMIVAPKPVDSVEEWLRVCAQMGGTTPSK